MKDVLINGRFLSQPITGVQRVAFEVVKNFDNLIDQGVIDSRKYSLTLLTEKNLKSEAIFKNISILPIGKRSGHIWEQLELSRYAHNSVLLNLCGPAPIFRRNQVAIIHDAVPFACENEFSWAFRTWYKTMFKSLCANSRELITVSDFSKEELSHYCGVDEKRFSVAHLGIDHFNRLEADLKILERNSLFDKKYVLAVGSLSPRKNFLRLIEAIEKLDDTPVELVVAGGVNSKVFSGIDLKTNDKIRYVGRVSDEELKALYLNALCFAFPSLYEGFGLPPVEAMSCGCPVIAADTSSIPEVCGEAVLYCDPKDADDIADKIRSLQSDDCLRKRLILKGTERASLFTWDSCGRVVWSAVERMFDEGRDASEASFASAV
jgi:glycosyltransferase involved in cell wall biosynthesis